MALETGTYISDLVAANPTSSDPKSSGDDHLRLVKSTIKNTFPNVTGAVNATQAELNQVVGLTAQAAAKDGSNLTTPAAGDSSTKIATTAFVAGTAFSSALPAQSGNAGKFVTTNGTVASWAYAGISTINATITTSTTLSGSYLYVPVAMTTLGQAVTLPSALTLSVGGPQYVIDNTKGGYPVGIRDNAGALLMAVAPGGEALVSLKDNTTQAGIWSVTGAGIESGLVTVDTTLSSTYKGQNLYPNWVALDNNTSLHCVLLTAGGFAVFIADNLGKVFTIPTTIIATANFTPRGFYKISATRAALFYSDGTTYKAIGLTLSGASPGLSLTLDATPISTATAFFDTENNQGAPQIAQLQPTLFLSSYCTTSGANPTNAIAVFDTGTQLILGAPLQLNATNSVAGTTTTYAKTSTVGECIFLSGTGPYQIGAVPVSVTAANPPVCSLGTVAVTAPSCMSTAAAPPSVNLSATKTFIRSDNNTSTTVEVRSITTTGTVSTISNPLTVETGLTGVAASYVLGTRVNPSMWALSGTTAGLQYMETSGGVSRAVVITDGLPPTAGAILYGSISSATGGNSGAGVIGQQGTSDFVALIQQASNTAGFQLALNPSKVSGTSITLGATRTLLGSAPGPNAAGNFQINRLPSGRYVVTGGSVNSLVTFTSNGDVISPPSYIPIPTGNTNPTAYPMAMNTASNRMVIQMAPKYSVTSAGQGIVRVLNVEFAQ